MLSLSDARALLMGLLLGGLGGALVPLGAQRASPSTAPSSAASPPHSPSAAPRDCTERERALSEAWARLEETEQRLLRGKEGIEELIGPEPAFADLPERFQPERVEDEVLAALGDSGAALEWIDCSEAPCIAVLSLSPEVWAREPGEVGDALREAMGTGHPWEAFGVGVGAFMTLPLGEAAADARLHQRLDLREEFLIQELAAASRSQP